MTADTVGQPFDLLPLVDREVPTFDPSTKRVRPLRFAIATVAARCENGVSLFGEKTAHDPSKRDFNPEFAQHANERSRRRRSAAY